MQGAWWLLVAHGMFDCAHRVFCHDQVAIAIGEEGRTT